jgi:hypothetical protein
MVDAGRRGGVALRSRSVAIKWGTGMVVVAFLAGVLTAGAVAFSVASFNDSGISCGAPIVAAVHGKAAAYVSDSDGKVQVLTKQQQADLSTNLSGQRLSLVSTVCRQPARGRVLSSVVALGAAVLGLVFMARRSGRASPTRQEPAPVPA